MANYATLKAAIQQVVKTNGNNEITGALLQQSLLSMITSLGVGYQFMDVATPQTTPGTPDQNVFYIGGPGTYSNMGGTVVNDGEIGIFRYNGSWSNKKLTVGKDYSNEIANLRRDKLDKIIGTNLVNPNDADYIENNVIFYNGTIGDAAASGYAVSGFIAVNGKNIISSTTNLGSSIAYYNVYDVNKNLLRTITGTAQYIYQSGDAFVRATLRYSNKRANYGTVLAAYEEYTDYAPVQLLQNQVAEIYGLSQQIPQKLDKIIGTNLVNPDEITNGAALSRSSTDGLPTTGLAAKYAVTGFIPINGNDIISNAWEDTTNTWASMFIYDANKAFLRNNGNNKQYTYQAGDAFVRISFNSSSISSRRANYGTTLANYVPFTEYAPVQELDARVTNLEEQLPAINPNYTTVALFKSAGVVGDSYSSGAIYLGGTTDGAHYNMSWLNIMARRNGIQSTGLYATPAQNTTKFLDPTDSRYNSYGLGALLADTAKDLYFIMLGINAEPDGVGLGTVEDCNIDWTQNATSFCGNLGKIIGNIKAHAANAKIVCIVANMLFSNLNPAVSSEKRAAIIAVSEFYGVAWMEAASDAFFSSSFYISCLRTNHPVGITYAGMANAFDRIFAQCVQANPTYFLDYVNQ